MMLQQPRLLSLHGGDAWQVIAAGVDYIARSCGALTAGVTGGVGEGGKLDVVPVACG